MSTPTGEPSTSSDLTSDPFTVAEPAGEHTAAPDAARRRRLQVIIGAIVLLAVVGAIVVAVIGSRGSQSTDVSATEIRYTSDTGRVTMIVPRSWNDRTDEFRAFVGQIANPGATVHVGWSFSDGVLLSSSSIIVTSYPGTAPGLDALATTSFGALQNAYAMFSDSYFSEPTTFTSAAGVTYARQDIVVTTPDVRIVQIELIAISDGTGFEIAITLVNDDEVHLNEVMDAVETLTLS